MRKMSPKITTWLISCLGISICCYLGAGCGSPEQVTPLADGFEVATHTPPNILMEPGHSISELRYRNSNGTPTIIWDNIDTEIFQKDGISVFSAQKYYLWDALDKRWGQESRVFAVRAAELPVDISTEIVGRWAKKSGRNVGTTLTNLYFNGIMNAKVEGDKLNFHFDQSDVNASDAADIPVSWGQINDMMQAVKEKGIVYKDPVSGTACYEMQFDPPVKK
jgi:hypothetical protein